jgi:hypothetical protein
MGDFYVTTFCNFAHRLKDGKPINHECYIIPPELLRLEMEADDIDSINKLKEEGECGEKWREWSLKRNRPMMRRGVKD